MALVGKAGVDRTQYLDILTSTLFGAPVYKTYGTLLAEEKFTPAGFAAPLGQKDIRLTLAAAEELRVPMPFGKKSPILTATLITRNHYPRAALLEAAVRYVEEDLRGRGLLRDDGK